MLSKIGRLASGAALIVGALALSQTPALAQNHDGGGHGGGGGFHGGEGGGGGGFHGAGGYHGGGGYGGYHGGGYHGGGWDHGGWDHGGWGHGGWGHGGWGHGGWGYGGWGYGGLGWGGWYGGVYPGFGLGYEVDDPFWAYGYDAGYPYYGTPESEGPSETYVQGPSYGQTQTYAQGQYAQGYVQGSAPVTANGGLPTDNSRGFYRWPVGIQGGACNRAYLEQTAAYLQGQGAASGAYLGGIAIAPVVDGRVGGRFSVADQACVTESLELAQTGQTVAWHTESGIPVTFEVTRTSERENAHCRDYVVTAQFANGNETARGRACKQPNGSWVAARRS